MIVLAKLVCNTKLSFTKEFPMQKRFLLGVLTIVCVLALSVGVAACGSQHQSQHQHTWVGEYAYDETYHWRTCETCDELDKVEHDFCLVAPDSGLPELCQCGAHQGEFAAYKVNFVLDNGVSVRVYHTQDAATGILTDFAYTRDGAAGTLLKDGNGQVNFEVVLPEGYMLNHILVAPEDNYKNLKDTVKDGNPNTYRITKITGDLTVTIDAIAITPKLCNFASVTDEDGKIKFSWDSNYPVDYVDIGVTVNNSQQNYTTENQTWETQLTANETYNFTFTAYFGEKKNSISCSRFYNPDIKSVSIPRVEISTANQIWPTCDYVSPPSGCWGGGITNNNYVYAAVTLYDAQNTLLYNSVSDTAADSYAGARIKIRGNTSAYAEKKPYKIKLSSKADLLAGLVPERSKADKDKEWLLLASGDYLNQAIGSSVSASLAMDWTPAYAYVSLYVNGDYRGLYILCESVKQGNSSDETQARCAVTDDGYIVELDAYWWNEDLYFTTPYVENTPMHYTFKFPDSDDINANSASYQYIKQYITDLDNALLNDDESYQNYLDQESFAKWLLAHDLLGSEDHAGTNIYLTKYDSTDLSKLKMGPLWDFDSIMATANSYARIRSAEFFYFPILTQKTEFVTIYNDLFEQVKGSLIVDLTEKLAAFDAAVFDDLITIENTRWATNRATFTKQKEAALTWFETRLLWLEQQS